MSVETKVFFTNVGWQSQFVQGVRQTTPDFQSIERFCEKTETYAREKGMRVKSITPIAGGYQVAGNDGVSCTVGFVVVFEKEA